MIITADNIQPGDVWTQSLIRFDNDWRWLTDRKVRATMVHVLPNAIYVDVVDVKTGKVGKVTFFDHTELKVKREKGK